MRVGHGFDVHRFVAGRPLMLGGVRIRFELGLEAHSDGDVVIHALCDALLGAAALGDIGSHFPDDDPAFKNVDSRLLLRRVMEQLKVCRLDVVNVDITVIAQVPKLKPHVGSMRNTLAEDLALSIDAINIKATTTEGLGFTGRKEGIAAHAVALLRQSDSGYA